MPPGFPYWEEAPTSEDGIALGVPHWEVASGEGLGSGTSFPRVGALPPVLVVCSVDVATQTSSGGDEEGKPQFPRRRSPTQLLEEALIAGIPGERDVWASQVEESEFLLNKGKEAGGRFVCPGRVSCFVCRAAVVGGLTNLPRKRWSP